MSPPKSEKELQASLGILISLSNSSPVTAEVHEPPRQFTSMKTEGISNGSYLELFDKTKGIIKEDACMKFYNKTRPLYLEMNTSGVGLGAWLLQTKME